VAGSSAKYVRRDFSRSQRRRAFGPRVDCVPRDPSCCPFRRPRGILEAMWRRLLGGLVVVLVSCNPESGNSSAADAAVMQPDSGPPAPAPTSECGSVRLTSYTEGASVWCEFHHTLSVLPASVQAGMTTAIAEPYVGGSYGGERGEACGECWEIDTLTGSGIVMVDNLCPIQGNPLCAGGHFHFDISTEAAAVLHGGGLDEAQTRRVACPVEGNASLEIVDRNDSGYLRFAVVNHRVPVRTVEFRSTTDTVWQPVPRSGGAWHVKGIDTFASGNPGGVFRITSAQGEQLESSNVLGYDVAIGSAFDLGVQFHDLSATTGPACVFEPPAGVYIDGYGGIDQVRWKMNGPWGSGTASEVTDGCYAGSCIRADGLASGSGFHIIYGQAFPSSMFATLALRLRAISGGGDVTVSASREGTRCQETRVTVGADWSLVTIDLATACASLDTINEVTVDARATMTLLVDDVQFSK
jgi:hypothetical protein